MVSRFASCEGGGFLILIYLNFVNSFKIEIASFRLPRSI